MTSTLKTKLSFAIEFLFPGAANAHFIPAAALNGQTQSSVLLNNTCFNDAEF